MTVSKEAISLWSRALEALVDAREVSSPNGKANRSYYAAFHAVSALFLLDGHSFKKHKGVSSAVHSELVKSGRWTKELGKAYTDLFDLRLTGDYGIIFGVSREEAEGAFQSARLIIRAVAEERPDVFSLPDDFIK